MLERCLSLVTAQSSKRARFVRRVARSASEGFTPTVEALCKHWAQLLHCVDNEGRTPLFYGITSGKLRIVEIMVDAKADVCPGAFSRFLLGDVSSSRALRL